MIVTFPYLCRQSFAFLHSTHCVEITLTVLMFLGTISCSVNISESENVTATLYFRLHNYSNPYGRVSNGDQCDRSSLCDPVFTICVSSSENPYSCSFLNATTDIFENKNYIEETIIAISQDIYFINPTSMHIFVNIRDYDYNRKNYEFVGSFAVNKTVTKMSGQQKLNQLWRNDTASYNLDVEVEIHFSISCVANRFGDSCQTLCIPQQEFECGANGEKICDERYMGKNCDAVNPCFNDTICADGAKCILDDTNNITCECNNSDHTCYRNHTFGSCLYKPCMNGGKCKAEMDQFHCVCSFPYWGSRCDQKRKPCKTDLCKNGGQCYIETNTIQCLCEEPFRGRFCETRISPCESNPCNNSGVCIVINIDNVTQTFKCECPSPFSGEMCSYRLPTISLLKVIPKVSGVALPSAVVLTVMLAPFIIFYSRRWKTRIDKVNINEDRQDQELSGIRHDLNDEEYLTPVVSTRINGGRQSINDGYLVLTSGQYDTPDTEYDPYSELEYKTYDNDNYVLPQCPVNNEDLKTAIPSLRTNGGRQSIHDGYLVLSSGQYDTPDPEYDPYSQLDYKTYDNDNYVLPQCPVNNEYLKTAIPSLPPRDFTNSL